MPRTLSFGFVWGVARPTAVGHAGLGRPDQLAPAAVLEALAPFLRDARPTKLCIDSKREIMALHAAGAELAGIAFDCMLASYLIDPERHSHSLADIARFDLDAALSDASKALLACVLVPGSLSGEDVTRAAELIAPRFAPLCAPATRSRVVADPKATRWRGRRACRRARALADRRDRHSATTPSPPGARRRSAKSRVRGRAAAAEGRDLQRRRAEVQREATSFDG